MQRFGLQPRAAAAPLLVGRQVVIMDGGDNWNAYQRQHRVLQYMPTNDAKPEDEESPVSLNAILPDDLLEKVLSFLPVAVFIRSGIVCKRWYDVVHSRRNALSKMVPQKPWYFMFNCGQEAVVGFAYDPTLRKWYDFEFPCIEKSNWSASSSSGLVCLMDRDDCTRMFVCNPITKDWRTLPPVPGPRVVDYSTQTISVGGPIPQRYTIAVMKCNRIPDDYIHFEVSIHMYDSRTKSWVTLSTEVLQAWRGGEECVMCGGTLYYLAYATVALGPHQSWHCLIAYDSIAKAKPSGEPLNGMAIHMPCPLTCGRLMNLRERLFLVGGIEKPDRAGVIKGIGIWELCGKDWHEVSRVPHKFLQGFGELDDVFSSNGLDDLIYIQSFGSPALLTFDTTQKVWKWSAKSPVVKRFPLQLFTGFCFEPRVDITS